MEKASGNIVCSEKKNEYDVEKIIERLKILSGMEIVYEVTRILREPKRNIIENIYKKLEKNHFLYILEKTLNIQNEGGHYYYKNSNNKRNLNKIHEGVNNRINSNSIKCMKTAGGVFFSLVKTSCDLNKEEIKMIFDPAENRKLDKQQYKLMKNVEKLLI